MSRIQFYALLCRIKKNLYHIYMAFLGNYFSKRGFIRFVMLAFEAFEKRQLINFRYLLWAYVQSPLDNSREMGNQFSVSKYSRNWSKRFRIIAEFELLRGDCMSISSFRNFFPGCYQVKYNTIYETEV